MSQRRDAPRGEPEPPLQALEATLLELLRVPSPTGGERPLRDRLLERLRASLDPLGAELHALHDGLAVRLPGPAAGPREEPAPSVALVGHLDVVEAPHGGPPRREGDRIYGPGASDMKAGLALMVELGERLAAAGGSPWAEPWLLFYAREEGPFEENLLAPMLRDLPALRALSLAVCLEPSDNRLQLGCMGSVHARAVVRGRAAHSARPWQGESAIVRALPLLQAATSWPERLVRIEGLAFREVLTATLLRAGRRRNVVPDRLELNLNFRFAPGQRPEEAFARLREALGPLCDELEPVDLSPAARPHRESPLVEHLRRCGTQAVEPKQAWTDVARFDALGVPAVNLGPGRQDQAHQPDEWTSLRALGEGYALLWRFLTTPPPAAQK